MQLEYAKELGRMLQRVVAEEDKRAAVMVCQECRLPFLSHMGAVKCIDCLGVIETKHQKALTYSRKYFGKKRLLKEAA